MKISIKKDEKLVSFVVDGVKYRTNNDGEGLFIYGHTGGYEYNKETKKYDIPIKEWMQIKGTCQFSLKQSTYSGMYSAIKRYFENREV